MVLIDGVKYACQSCIKGHRSSKCTHTTRPLTEIKKKGRPTSQCTHCRELRKTKSVHGRCDCAAREAEQKPSARLLPNGLADAVHTPEPEGAALTTTEPSGVTRLLNPCNCLRGGKCTCCSVVKRGAPKAFPQDEPDAPVASTSAASGCCSSRKAVAPSAARSVPDVTPGPSPPTAPLDFTADIPVSPLPSPSADFPVSLSSYIPPPPNPSFDPLYLPSTHGTHACFCGPTCGCVGCAVHDPYSRKRPAPGACSGGGCRCGTDRGCEGGKRVRVTPPGTAGGCCASGGGEAMQAPPAPASKSCCGGGGGGKGTAPSPPLETSGIELPSLWAYGALPSADALPHFPAAALPPATSRPLPSLRTLYPALLDLELDLPGSDPAAAQPSQLDDAAGVPAGGAGAESSGRTDCSAVYLEDPLDDACGSGSGDGDDEGCHCSSECGCRGGGGLSAGTAQEEPEGEGEMARVAELAALGAFG